MLRCRLCLADQTKIKCELVKDTVLEIVEALCIPPKVLTGPDAAICEVCCEKLQSLSQFKSKCISVEAFLRPYYSTDENVDISLCDILSKNKENHGEEDVEICRLCLNTTKQSLLLSNLVTKDNYQNVFDIHLPELDLKTTKHCLVCATCIQNLDNFAELTKCISATQELMMSEDIIPEGNIPSADNQGTLLIKEEGTVEELIEDELVNNIIKVNVGSNSQSTNVPNHNRLLIILVPNRPAVSQAQLIPLLVCNKDSNLPVNSQKKQDHIIKCNMCPKLVTTNSNCLRHIREKHSEHELPCPKSDYKGSTKANVKTHIKQMHPNCNDDSRRLKCGICSKQFTSVSNRNRHYRDVHIKQGHCDSKPVNEIEQIYLDRKPVKKEIQCYKCFEKFAIFRYLVRHLKEIHKDTMEGYELCNRCGYKADTAVDLKKHKTIHPATVKCRLCPKVFHLQKSLGLHFLKHHTDTSKLEKLECLICGFKTPFKTQLRCHIERHLQLKHPTDYKCASCNFSTRSHPSLYAHKRIKHGTDSFKCKLCDYTAKVEHRLKRHYNNMHKDISEVKLFTCSVCSFQTKYPASFETHQLLHKKPSMVTKYHCAHCSFKTIYRHKFSHHLKKKHLMGVTSVSTNDTLNEDR